MSLPGIGNGTGLPTGSTNDGATSNDPQAATAWVDSSGNLVSGVNQTPISGNLGIFTSVDTLQTAFPAVLYPWARAAVGANPYYSDGSSWVPAGVRVLAQSSVPITLTGTTAGTVMGSIIVPANCMGLNGTLRMTVSISMTNNANVKTLLVRWGNSYKSFISVSLGSQPTEVIQAYVSNRGATGSQLLSGAGTAASYGSGLPAFTTDSQDTTQQQPIQFVGVLANATDTLTIERYCLELLP